MHRDLASESESHCVNLKLILDDMTLNCISESSLADEMAVCLASNLKSESVTATAAAAGGPGP